MLIMRSLGKVCKIFILPLLLAAALVPAAAGAGETIVVKVNGVPITSTEVEEAIDQLLPRGIYHGKVSEDQREEFRESALEALITMELQYQDALARGMKPDRKQVKEQMRKTREAFRTEWEYNIWLQKSGMNEDLLRKRIERVQVVRAAIERIAEEPSRPSDEMLLQYYDAGKEKLREPESVRVRIISVKKEQSAAKALESVKRGEDFASVAARMSEDGYRDKGGDIGQVRKGMIYPQLETVAFGLKKGEVSEPVFAEGMWFLLKVDDVLPARIPDFSEVREKLKRDLEQKRMAELLSQWVDGLRAKAEVVVVSPE